jgi:hypothetical protein
MRTATVRFAGATEEEVVQVMGEMPMGQVCLLVAGGKASVITRTEESWGVELVEVNDVTNDDGVAIPLAELADGMTVNLA